MAWKLQACQSVFVTKEGYGASSVLLLANIGQPVDQMQSVWVYEGHKMIFCDKLTFCA